MNFSIHPLAVHQSKEARDLCLRNIAVTFGDTYNPRWAYDLDALGTEQDFYVEKEKGIFLIAMQGNTLIGTLGIRSFRSQEPAVPDKVIALYPEKNSVAYITRAYVEEKFRGNGVGKVLVSEGEKFCLSHYKTIYLHTHPNLVYDSVRFWKSRGYTILLEEYGSDPTIHMEKKLQR